MMIDDDDNDSQMIFGDLGGLNLPDICLTGEEKPRKKTSPRKLVPTGDRTRVRCATGAHATVPQRCTKHFRKTELRKICIQWICDLQLELLKRV